MIYIKKQSRMRGLFLFTSLFCIYNHIFPNHTAAQQAVNKIRLPVLVPLTGSAGEQGQWVKDGLTLAVEEFNVSPSKKPQVELLVEDTQADNKLAISEYQRLKSLEEFPVVFTYGSGIGISLTPFVNKDQVVQMGLATASPAYKTADDFTFRNFPSADLEAQFVSSLIKDKFKQDSVAVIKQNNDYGIGTAKAFVSAYSSAGGKISFEESIEPKDSDFRALITRLKPLNPQLIFLALYPSEGAIFIKQLRELGITSQVIAGVAILGSKEFFSITGKSAEGMITISSSPELFEGTDQKVIEFRKKFSARFNEEFGPQHIFAARAYDAGRIVIKELENCPVVSGKCLKDSLYQAPEYQGVSGKIKFDNAGDINAQFKAFIVKNAKFEAFDESAN